jgi:hypothetical protein
MLFSEFCPEDTRKSIKEELKVDQSHFEEKYLGLPTPEGRMKAAKFQPIKERFSKRLTDWSEKYMSTGAKDVLIKSVAQAIPTSVMGVFKMSAQFCEDYMKMVRDFWWGDERNRRKTHWLAWEKLTCPKTYGGLGFRDIKCFNQALLARQAWRLIMFPESLCARVLKAKYYPNGDLLDTAFPKDSSTPWKGIVYGLELLKKGMIWRIGNGEAVKIWRHQWLPRDSKVRTISKRKWNRLTYVKELMIEGEKQWDEPRVRHLLHPEDAEAVLKIRIPQREMDDFPAWYLENNGLLSVRSAYKFAWSLSDVDVRAVSSSHAPDGERKIWKALWKTEVQPKIKIFGVCPVCGHEIEDSHRAVIRCTKARALRYAIRKVWSLPDESMFEYT